MIMHYILLPDFFNELYVLELPSLDSQKKKKKKKRITFTRHPHESSMLVLDGYSTT